MSNYKAAAEKTDEAERLLTPAFRRTTPYNHDEECEAALHDELNRLRKELPEMRKENKRLTDFLQDAAAFIRSANTDKLWNDNIVLATLVHDITGLANDEPCFSPRVTGYAQREQERKP
jgi:hypothetical protein